VVETTAQTSGAILVPRFLTAGHKPSNPNKYARRPKYERRAQDNIQEVCFWQEKKLQPKTIAEESFTVCERDHGVAGEW
jgi:hypothetical protein